MPISPRVPGYPISWLSSDLVAGVTLAAYAIPVALADATRTGPPPRVGVYGDLTGGPILVRTRTEGAGVSTRMRNPCL